jgi:predicted TIM-barrel fold metal-dependent hydrolase
VSQNVIDVNVDLFRWPLRRLHGDETPDLVRKLREHDVTQAWCGSFEGISHFDIEGVNERLARECKQHGHGILIPFGSVNPMLPDWEEDLRRCKDVHHMRGIRLHPNYHGYKLDDPKFLRLLELATERHLIVQLAVLMEDKRMQHELQQTAPVEITPLEKIVEKVPGLRLVLLNGFQGTSRPLLWKLAATKKVYFEIATLEGVAAITSVLKQMPVTQLLFGSHAPFFYFEAAYLKLKESALDEYQMKAITAANARELLR